MHSLQTVLFFCSKEQKQTALSLNISNPPQSKWILTHTSNLNANAKYNELQFSLTPLLPDSLRATYSICTGAREDHLSLAINVTVYF
jgi:hypothetical protein